MIQKEHITVIGVGNPHRGDDAVGLLAARHLMDRAPENVSVLLNFGEIASLTELLDTCGMVIFVDAVLSGSEPGSILRFDATNEKLPADHFHHSTHSFCVPEAIEFARALGQFPRKVIVYGIEGKDFETGREISPEVENAVPAVVGCILEDIICWMCAELKRA
jgi:hydrogenase maturation protease